MKSPSLIGSALALLFIPAAWALTPTEILQKSAEKYKSLTSYSATGKTVSIIGAAEVNADKVLEQGFQKPHNLVHTFTIKLGRPDLYHIQWEQKVHAAYTQKGAVWSAGEGDFLLMGEARYSKMKNQAIALAAATGISGGAAHTVPAAFFANTGPNLLRTLSDVSLEKEEKIDAEDCYVVAGRLGEQKMLFWVSKESFLIRQRQLVLGGNVSRPAMTDEMIKKTLKQLKREATPAAVAEMKAMAAMAGKTKGTLTETHQNIVIDQPIDKASFRHPVPNGLKPSASPF